MSNFICAKIASVTGSRRSVRRNQVQIASTRPGGDLNTCLTGWPMRPCTQLVKGVNPLHESRELTMQILWEARNATAYQCLLLTSTTGGDPEILSLQN